VTTLAMGLVPYAQIIFLFGLAPARNAGVVSDARWAAFQATKGTIREATHLMKRTSFSPQVRKPVRHVDNAVLMLVSALGLGNLRIHRHPRWHSEKVPHCLFPF
jgi:hypothetical protein